MVCISTIVTHNICLYSNYGLIGTAIYAFCADIIVGSTSMTFFIDDERVGQFSRNSGGASYNIPVFVNTNLLPGEHVFTLMNGALDGSGNVTLVLFDYLIYS